jgi:hypothetical protein
MEEIHAGGGPIRFLTTGTRTADKALCQVLFPQTAGCHALQQTAHFLFRNAKI